MELHYELRINDYKAAVKQLSAQVSKAAKMPYAAVVMVAIIVAGAVLIGLLFPGGTSMTATLLLGAVIAGAMLSFAAFTGSRSQRYLNQAYGGGLTAIEVQLALRAEGISLQTSTGPELTYWYTVKRIEDFGDYIVVRFGINGEHTIPKRAFQDAQHMQVFLGEFQRLWHAAAAPPAPQPFPAPPQHPSPLQPNDPNTPPVQ